MKICVIVYGMCRSFDIAVKSWEFRHHLDCDFYFSTWRTMIQKSRNTGIIISETITEATILRHIPNAKIQIFNEYDFFDPSNTHYPNVQKMVFHLKHALAKVNESGIKYDILVLTRTDSYMEFSFPYNEIYSKNIKNKVYGSSYIGTDPHDPKLPFVNDIIFFGDFDVMSDMIKKIGNCIMGPHNDLAQHFIDLNLVVEPGGIKVTTVRPNVRELPENEWINPSAIFSKQMEWGFNDGY